LNRLTALEDLKLGEGADLEGFTDAPALSTASVSYACHLDFLLRAPLLQHLSILSSEVPANLTRCPLLETLVLEQSPEPILAPEGYQALKLAKLLDQTEVSIPVLYSLARCPELRVVGLSEITDQALDILTSCTKIEEVILEDLDETCQLSALRQWSRLHTVALLTGSEDLDLAQLSQCPTLANLALIRFDDGVDLDSLPLEQLTHLDLTYSTVEDWSPFSRRNLQRLQVLNLEGCYRVDDEMLSHVANCSNLCELNLSNTHITQVFPLSMLVFLEKLDLSYTKVTSVRDLQRCVNLKQLLATGGVYKMQ
jgi:Leucine-rich repeat (LRR) protein